LEAYRDHRLEDATGKVRITVGLEGRPVNPEGGDSEFADVLIRLLDTVDIFGIGLGAEYERKLAFNRSRSFQHGGRTLSDVGRVQSSEENRP